MKLPGAFSAEDNCIYYCLEMIKKKSKTIMWKWRREQVSGQQDSSIRCYIRLRSDERNVSILGSGVVVWFIVPVGRLKESRISFSLFHCLSCYIGPCTMIAPDYRHPISSINSIKSDSYSVVIVVKPIHWPPLSHLLHQCHRSVVLNVQRNNYDGDMTIRSIGKIQTSPSTRSVSNNIFLWFKFTLHDNIFLK